MRFEFRTPIIIEHTTHLQVNPYNQHNSKKFLFTMPAHKRISYENAVHTIVHTAKHKHHSYDIQICTIV